MVQEVIAELEGKIGKLIPIEDVTRESVGKGLEQARVEEIIEKMKRTGDIAEPRYGFIERI